MHVPVVILAKITHSFRLTDRPVLTCDMVGNKVDDNFHTGFMRTLNESLKLRHPLVYVYSDIGVYVIIVCNGIRRTRLPLHHGRMLPGNAMYGIVCHSGMTYHTRIPYMRNAERLDTSERGGIEIVHLAATVFSQCTTLAAILYTIAEKAGKYLINNYFCHK